MMRSCCVGDAELKLHGLLRWGFGEGTDGVVAGGLTCEPKKDKGSEERLIWDRWKRDNVRKRDSTESSII